MYDVRFFFMAQIIPIEIISKDGIMNIMVLSLVPNPIMPISSNSAGKKSAFKI